MILRTQDVRDQKLLKLWLESCCELSCFVNQLRFKGCWSLGCMLINFWKLYVFIGYDDGIPTRRKSDTTVARQIRPFGLPSQGVTEVRQGHLQFMSNYSRVWIPSCRTSVAQSFHRPCSNAIVFNNDPIMSNNAQKPTCYQFLLNDLWMLYQHFMSEGKSNYSVLRATLN